MLVADAYLASTTPTYAAENRKARDEDRVQTVLNRSGEWFGHLRAADWEEAHRIAASGLLDARWDVVDRTLVAKRTRFLIQLLDPGGRRSIIRCRPARWPLSP